MACQQLGSPAIVSLVVEDVLEQAVHDFVHFGHAGAPGHRSGSEPGCVHGHNVSVEQAANNIQLGPVCDP